MAVRLEGHRVELTDKLNWGKEEDHESEMGFSPRALKGSENGRKEHVVGGVEDMQAAIGNMQ